MTEALRRSVVVAATVWSLAACSSQPETASAPAPTAAAATPAAVDPTTLPKGPRVYVTNERSGNLTVINAQSNEAMATIPLGKRPRGIKLAPDGTTLYIALSGSPIAPPGVDEKTLPTSRSLGGRHRRV